MKVLLVFINNEYRPMVPINLNCLEGYIKERGHQVKVFDASFYRDVLNIENLETHINVGTYFGVDYSDIGVKIKDRPAAEDLVEMVARYKPDLIGFGVYSYFEKMADKMTQAVKRSFPDIPTIWGGIHTTIVPEATISKPWVDMICVGEGEKALLNLCNRMERGDSIEDVENIWIKKDGNIIRNPVGPLIDPNELPTPNWESYATYHQYGPIEGKRYKLAMVEFSRGCPFSCAYCENCTIKNVYLKAGFKKYVRHKSPEKFVSDCEFLVNHYGIEMFYITDGTFLVMPDSVLEELVALYRKRVNRPFLCLTTVPTVTEERARLIKEMGCFQVNMGVESGNEEYRRTVLNRPNMSNDRIVAAFKALKDVGIRISSYNIIGVPWQNREGVFETIELNRIIQPDRTNVSIYIPFKGTQLTERLMKEGYISDNTILGDETQCTVNMPCDMDREEILGLYRTFNLYCKVPKELFPLVETCEKDNETSGPTLKNLRETYLTNKG